MGALYEIRKQRLSNRYRLFMQYMKLCKQNNRKLAYGLTEEIAQKEFDEEFLKILIFSEKKTEILKRHMAEIEKEISEIFPHDNDKAREEIRRYCGKYTSIEVGFDCYKNNKHNSLGFSIGGMA